MNPPDPEITILITAHNEAERLPASLHAIVEQDYPMERVEIVLVDDRSTDGTADVARQLSLPMLRVFELTDLPAGLSARQAAIHLGITQARGEIILLTDAGARVPREWIRELTGHLGYRDAAVTGPIIYAGPHGLLNNYMTIDALVLFTIYRWLHSHNRPAGVFGANLAIRREAYEQIGGHPGVGFHFMEDAALGSAFKQAGWSIRYLQEPFVQNPGPDSAADLLARARRLAVSPARGLHQITLLVVLSNWLLIGLTLYFHTRFWDFVLLFRYIAGLLFIGFSISRYPKYQSQAWLLFFEPIFTVVTTLAYLTNLFKPSWKWGGLVYNKKGLA